MKKIDYLYDFVNKSNFTTIAYNHKDESLKDAMLSKLSIFRLKDLDTLYIKSSIKQKIRENRLDCILNNTEGFIDIAKFDYLLVDLEDIRHYKDLNSRRIIIDFLKSDGIENGYKVIFTTTTCKSLSASPMYKLKSGEELMYISDLVFMLTDGLCKIYKNRFGVGCEIICLDELK